MFTVPDGTLLDSLKNNEMTEQEQQQYFALAAKHQRLERLYMGSKIGAGKKFDRVVSVAMMLGAIASYQLGQGNIPMMLLYGTLIVIGVHLAGSLFRRLLSRTMNPLFDEVLKGGKLAHDMGWNAGMNGESVETCPFVPEQPGQARYAKQWMDGHRRALYRLRQSPAA
ncbi:hypothetical protein KUW04_04480 [Halomonas denitrificans]|nr:hypothetical protein [Halomonas denitrificans]